MKVFRSQIGITDYQVLDLANNAQLLSVAVSRTIPNHGIDLWWLDRDSGGWPDQEVAIYVIGTGNPMPDELLDHDEWSGHPPNLPLRRFIGTVVTPSGLVWHIFQGPVR